MEWNPTKVDATDDYTLPGVYALRLYREHGVDRRFFPVACYHVSEDGKVTRVKIVELRCGEDYTRPAYAITDSGKSLPAFYLFPTNRHRRPELREMLGGKDEWVAPWREGVLGPWPR